VNGEIRAQIPVVNVSPYVPAVVKSAGIPAMTDRVIGRKLKVAVKKSGVIVEMRGKKAEVTAGKKVLIGARKGGRIMMETI
jgi:hypothetical protein